jgi:hypothetical protein
MKRAFKTIPLLLTLQNEGNSVALLYKRGILTDDLHNDMKELKSFIDVEFQEVQNEAEELVEGWGQLIWPQAMQYHQVSLLLLYFVHSYDRSRSSLVDAKATR